LGNEVRWELNNFEPIRKDNLEVRVMHVDIWPIILELRSNVEQNPNDVDSWEKLANWYVQFSIFGAQDVLHYSIDHHFANLALEARQKVVELRPERGDAHYLLAKMLWYTNPKVEERFGYSER
jgi:cytochrome c-type biogenesis protein CcmH/NrfG